VEIVLQVDAVQGRACQRQDFQRAYHVLRVGGAGQVLQVGVVENGRNFGVEIEKRHVVGEGLLEY